jgi:ERCC4-related helicase
MVLDTGVCKEHSFDPKRNMAVLQESPISKSSAIQRAGRAGRTQPGSCYRLFSQDSFDKSNTCVCVCVLMVWREREKERERERFGSDAA